MKRRDFLKICSSLPFIGSLFAQGDSGASEGQPEGCLPGENDILRDLPMYPADHPIGNHRGIVASEGQRSQGIWGNHGYGKWRYAGTYQEWMKDAKT